MPGASACLGCGGLQCRGEGRGGGGGGGGVKTCRRELQQEGLDSLGVQEQLLTASLPNLAAPVPGQHKLGLLTPIQDPVMTPGSIALVGRSAQDKTLVPELVLHSVWVFTVGIAPSAMMHLSGYSVRRWETLPMCTLGYPRMLTGIAGRRAEA